MTPGPAEVSLRVATPSDSGAIAVLRALWATDAPPPADFQRRVAAWLAEEGDRRTTWLAIAGEEAIGMASLFEYRRMPSPVEPDSAWGYVGHLFVRRDLRRRGVGSALLGEIVDAAERRGYARLVASPSRDALTLFGRCGFVSASGAPGNDGLLVRTHRPRSRPRT